MHKPMVTIGILFVFVGIAGMLAVAFFGANIVALDTVSTPNLSTFGTTNSTMMRGNSTVYTNMMRNMMTDFSKDTYVSEGERIFLTATDNSGYAIEATLEGAGIPAGGMMTRRIACANCHGEDAKGDFLFPDGTTRSADIRWTTLESDGFDSAAFKRAVTLGEDETGKKLSIWMPRWTITDAQLEELEAYLKTL